MDSSKILSILFILPDFVMDICHLEQEAYCPGKLFENPFSFPIIQCKSKYNICRKMEYKNYGILGRFSVTDGDGV
jgi:hypothetical protein